MTENELKLQSKIAELVVALEAIEDTVEIVLSRQLAGELVDPGLTKSLVLIWIQQKIDRVL